MKLRVVIDMDVSNTLAETMQRNGFSAKPDGTAMKIEIPNSPIIPKRKTKVAFIENPEESLVSVITGSQGKLVAMLEKLITAYNNDADQPLLADARKLISELK